MENKEKAHEAFRTRIGLIYLKENGFPEGLEETECESGYVVFGENEEMKFYPNCGSITKFHVLCTTKAEYFAVLLWHERMGHKWCTGVEPMYHHKLWDESKEKTVVGVDDGFRCIYSEQGEYAMSFEQFCTLYILLKK